MELNNMKQMAYSILSVVFIFLISCNKIQENTSKKTISDVSKDESNDYTAEYKGKKMKLNEFISWYHSNDCKLSKFYTVSELEYNIKYIPSECLSFIELKREDYDYEKFCKTKVSYEGMIYFNLKIELVNGNKELLKYNLESPQNYEERIKYISFDMQNDIFAIQGKDTVYPGLYQFERIFDVAPYCTIMLAFDGKELHADEKTTIVYNDRLFNNGQIKFHYKKGQLIDLPIVAEL